MAKSPNPSTPVMCGDGMIMEGLVNRAGMEHLVMPNKQPATIGSMMPKTTAEPVRPPVQKPFNRKK
ncbi:hypothetical protein D3C77_677620 [compost metagenome]